jgi:hypothetical protein
VDNIACNSPRSQERALSLTDIKTGTTVEKRHDRGTRVEALLVGVPVVLEQKTTILWKCLYLLAALKDSPGLGRAYETNRRGGEENPVYGRNTTVNVDKIRGFRPPYVWTLTFVFFLTIAHERMERCFLYAY